MIWPPTERPIWASSPAAWTTVVASCVPDWPLASARSSAGSRFSLAVAAGSRRFAVAARTARGFGGFASAGVGTAFSSGLFGFGFGFAFAAALVVAAAFGFGFAVATGASASARPRRLSRFGRVAGRLPRTPSSVAFAFAGAFLAGLGSSAIAGGY